jgi:hypothetical protein
MSTIKSNKGQVTISEPIREEEDKAGGAGVSDRFEAVRGKADIKGRTDDLMTLLRSED